MQSLFRQTIYNNQTLIIIYGLLGLFFCLFLAEISPKISFLAAIFIILAAFFAWRLEWGIYLLAFFLPVIHWDLYFFDLIIPLIDALGLVMISALFLRYTILYFWAPRQIPRLKWPFFFPYALFALAALASSFLAPDILESLWYSARWILFFYTAYVFVPINVISDPKILKKTLIAFVLSGLAVTLMGVLSFMGQDWRHAYVRTLPISVLGIWPLGQNQNLIAEVLLPAFFYALLWRSQSQGRMLKLLNIGLWAMAAVLVLTFSRAAWISLLVCGFLYLLYHYRADLRRILIPAFLVATVMMPIFAYMYLMQTDYSIGVGSTRSRVQSTQIALSAFADQPWLGQGPGEYMDLVENNVRFTATFGQPLEAHGLVQKILAENGGIGFVAFVLMMSAITGQIIYYIRRYPQHRAWLIPIALAALSIFIFQLTNTSYYKGKLWLPIAIAWASGPVMVSGAKLLTRNPKPVTQNT